MHAVVDELGLLGEVAVPDDEVLRPEHVRPQDAEPEQQLADVVKLVGTDVLGQVQPLLRPHRDHGEERQPQEQVADEVVAAREGREPVGVERHEEVEPDEGEHPAVGDEHGGGEAALRPLRGVPLVVDAAPSRDEAAGEPGGGMLARLVEQPDVGPHGPVDVPEAEAGQEQERAELAAHEERDVEPRRLGLDRLVHPRRPALDPGQQDQEQPERDGQERGGGLGHPLEGPAPAGGSHLHDGRDHHPRLGEAAEDEEADEQRLPRADGVAQEQRLQERESAEHRGDRAEAPGAIRDEGGSDRNHVRCPESTVSGVLQAVPLSAFPGRFRGRRR